MATFDVGSISATIGVDESPFMAGLRRATTGLKNFAGKVKEKLVSLKKVMKTSFSAMLLPLTILRSGFSALRNTIGKLTGFMFNMKSMILGLAASFGALQLAKQAEDATQLAQAFRQLAHGLGSTADDALSKLREALKGTVSDLDIMKQVSNAAILGVGNNIEEMAQIFQAARRLGQATGRSATEAVGDIVVGIGRQSRLILDNIGLIVKVEKANEAYARQLGKSKDDLTDTEKRIAFLNATMEAAEEAVRRLGDEQETFAMKFQRFSASLSNFSTELAVKLAPAMGRFLDSLTSFSAGSFKNSVVFLTEQTLDRISKWLSSNGGRVQSFLDKTGNALVLISGAIRSIISGIGGRLLAFWENPTLAIDFVMNQLASALTLWLGIGQLVVGGVLAALDSNKGTFSNFFAMIAAKFSAAFEPLGALFDQFIMKMESFLPQMAVDKIHASREERLNELSRELYFLKEKLDRDETNIARLQHQSMGPHLPGGGGGTLGGVERTAGEAQELLRVLTGNREISLARMKELEVLVKQEQAMIGSAQDLAKSVAEQNLTRAEVMLESSRTSLVTGLEGVLKNITGKDLTQIRKEVDTLFREFQDKINAMGVEGSFFGFLLPSKQEIEVALNDLNKIAGKSGEEIAASYGKGFESFSIMVKSVNTLVAVQRSIAEDTSLLDIERNEAAKEQVRLEEVLLEILRAKSIINEEEIANEEKRKRNLEEEKQAKSILAETEEAAAQALASLEVERLSVADQRALVEENTVSAMERSLDRINIHLGRQDNLREKILSALRQTLGLENNILDLQQQSQFRDTVDAASQNLEVMIATLQGEDELAAVRRTQHKEQLIADGNSILQVETLMAYYDELIAKQKKITEEKEKQSRLDKIGTGIVDSLIHAAQTGENAFRSFTRSFVGDFKQETSKGLEELADSFKDMLGDKLTNFFGSGTFAGILGLIGMLTQRRSSSSVTEIPTEDIVGSTTTVRGVVAGPESIAISEIGTSLREANRGVEILLTDIRNTLYSIESGGLDSGGQATAGLV